MSSDVIEVQCQCGRKVRAPKTKAGETGKCPYCRGPITIPLVEENEISSNKASSNDIKTKARPITNSASSKGNLTASYIPTKTSSSTLAAKSSSEPPEKTSKQESWMDGQHTARRPIHLCPKCGHDNPKDAVECQDCHASLKTSGGTMFVPPKQKATAKRSSFGVIIALFLVFILGCMVGIAFGPEYFDLFPRKTKIMQWLKIEPKPSHSNFTSSQNSNNDTSINISNTSTSNSNNSEPLPPPLIPVRPKLTQSRFLGDWYERLKIQLAEVDSFQLQATSTTGPRLRFDTPGARIKLQTAYTVSGVIQNNWPSEAQEMGDGLERSMKQKDVNLWIQKKQSIGEIQKANTLANFKTTKIFNPISGTKLSELESAIQRVKSNGDILKEVDVTNMLKILQAIQREYDNERQELNSAILSFEAD